MDWFDLLVVKRTLKSLLQHHSSKARPSDMALINMGCDGGGYECYGHNAAKPVRRLSLFTEVRTAQSRLGASPKASTLAVCSSGPSAVNNASSFPQHSSQHLRDYAASLRQLLPFPRGMRRESVSGFVLVEFIWISWRHPGECEPKELNNSPELVRRAQIRHSRLLFLFPSMCAYKKLCAKRY